MARSTRRSERFLTVSVVETILADCLFNDEEPPDNAVFGEGVLHNYGFHPDRLKSHESEIERLLNELPEAFHEGTGGGMPFTAADTDKHGNEWADRLKMVEMLICLGIAIGKVKWYLPRNLWHTLPKGIPYVTVLKEKSK